MVYKGHWNFAYARLLIDLEISHMDVSDLSLILSSILPGSPSDLNTGNGTEGAMVCTSLGSLLRPLCYLLCSNLKANPVHTCHVWLLYVSFPQTLSRRWKLMLRKFFHCPLTKSYIKIHTTFIHLSVTGRRFCPLIIMKIQKVDMCCIFHEKILLWEE